MFLLLFVSKASASLGNSSVFSEDTTGSRCQSHSWRSLRTVLGRDRFQELSNFRARQLAMGDESGPLDHFLTQDLFCSKCGAVPGLDLILSPNFLAGINSNVGTKPKSS